VTGYSLDDQDLILGMGRNFSDARFEVFHSIEDSSCGLSSDVSESLAVFIFTVHNITIQKTTARVFLFTTVSRPALGLT
jgi:hypothetical protein